MSDFWGGGSNYHVLKFIVSRQWIYVPPFTCRAIILKNTVAERACTSLPAVCVEGHFTLELQYTLPGNPERNPEILMKSFGNPKSV